MELFALEISVEILKVQLSIYSKENILKYFSLLLLDWRQCGISVTNCALVANKGEGALVFVINNPFSPALMKNYLSFQL